MPHCENLFNSVTHARTTHWCSLQHFTKFNQLILSKIFFQICFHQMPDCKAKIQQIQFLLVNPTVSLQRAPLDPIVGLKSLLSEGKGGERTGRKKKGRGREKEEGTPSFPRLFLPLIQNKQMHSY